VKRRKKKKKKKKQTRRSPTQEEKERKPDQAHVMNGEERGGRARWANFMAQLHDQTLFS